VLEKGSGHLESAMEGIEGKLDPRRVGENRLIFEWEQK
jgi:hypothetical protein